MQLEVALWDALKVHTKKRSSFQNKSAFLLFETILALFVASILALMAFGFLSNSVNLQDFEQTPKLQNLEIPTQNFYEKQFD